MRRLLSMSFVTEDSVLQRPQRVEACTVVSGLPFAALSTVSFAGTRPCRGRPRARRHVKLCWGWGDLLGSQRRPLGSCTFQDIRSNQCIGGLALAEIV